MYKVNIFLRFNGLFIKEEIRLKITNYSEAIQRIENDGMLIDIVEIL
jgi:hypothetical protein